MKINIFFMSSQLLLIYNKMPLLYFVYSYTFDFLLLSVGYYFTYQRKQRSIYNWSFDLRLSKKLLAIFSSFR